MNNRQTLPGRPDAIFGMVEDYSRRKEYDKAERLIENYVYYCIHHEDWKNKRILQNAADSLESMIEPANHYAQSVINECVCEALSIALTEDIEAAKKSLEELKKEFNLE